MNILTSILSGLKGLAITAILPIVNAESPEAGKALADGAAAFADGKLSLEEAKDLALDGIDIAKKYLPKYAAAFDALKVNISEDASEIATKIIPHFETTFNAFKAAQAS